MGAQFLVNPATEFAAFVTFCLVSIKVIYELVLLLKKQFDGKANTGVYCNYPLQGGGCVYASKEYGELQKFELTRAISNELREPLNEQNRLLGEIRDGVRDMRRTQ